MKRPLDIVALILRLLVGCMMLLHGIAKIQRGVEGIGNKMADVGLPEFLAYSVFIGEIVAPLMLILGWRTKIGGILLAFTMVVAVWLAHMDDIFTLSKGGAWGIELQAFYFFTSLCLVFTGGGKYATSKNNKWD